VGAWRADPPDRLRHSFVAAGWLPDALEDEVHLVLAVLALQDPGRYRQALDHPEDLFAVLVPARHFSSLVPLAANGHGVGADDPVTHAPGLAVVHHAVVERLACGGVARDREVEQHRVEVARAQRHRPPAVVLDVAAPAGFAGGPVVGRVLVALPDQEGGRIAVGQRLPGAAVGLEHGDLLEPGDRAVDAEAVGPAVAAGRSQGHGAGGVHAHGAGVVGRGERLQAAVGGGHGRGQRQREAGGGQQRAQRAAAGSGDRIHWLAPVYSTSRRSVLSSPSSTWRILTGVGTPLATQTSVRSLPSTRSTLVAL